jgi:hypothetical protein
VIFAYADPPYPGQARTHYSHDPRCAEVNHKELFARLEELSPDAWALSTSSVALHSVLEVAPPGIRIGAWVKPFCSFKYRVNPAYSWEPVIFKGGRAKSRNYPKVRDWCSANVTIQQGLAGAKPEDFCFWLFRLMGLEHGDSLLDLYPGTGAVTKAWEKYARQLSIPFTDPVDNSSPPVDNPVDNPSDSTP